MTNINLLKSISHRFW